MRILVVDDDASSLATAVSFLLPYGKCDDASDRESALARFRSGIDAGAPYQLVLVDINVAGAGGETLLAVFREIEDQSNLPPDQRARILVTSERSGRQMITDCLLSGCDDFLEKPLDKAKLIGKLHDHGLLVDKAPAASASEKTALDGAELADRVVKQLSTGDPELPPAMKIAMRVRQLIDCGAEIADVANLLRQDSAISTQLLKTANSAYYRGMGRSTSIDQAINRLGLSRASELVMSLCCRGFFTTTHPPYQTLVDRLWWHSLACAHATQMPFLNPGGEADEDLFSIGLLHDTGKLLLLQAAADVARRKVDRHTPASEAELIELMDAHHVRLGVLLMQKMACPEIYGKAVQRHHDPATEEKEIPRQLKILQQANWLAKRAGFSLAPMDPEALDTMPEALAIDAVTREKAIAELPLHMEQLRYLFG